MDIPTELFQQTVEKYISPLDVVVKIEPAFSDDLYQSWSVAALKRYKITLDNGAALTLITKTMELKEWQVLVRLSEQGHAHVPYTHTLDLITPGPKLACMQDVASNEVEPDGFEEKVANALADIHISNLGKGAEMPWLPQADPVYFKDFLVKEVWRAHWDKALATNPAFAREFEVYTPRIEEAASRFIAAMTDLWHEGTSLTATHGEIHPTHVKVFNGQPYFVDWGWTYYGSFYLDLPAWFTPQNVLSYHKALAKRGLEIREADFMERFNEASRYVGFKYLCAGIWNWPPGPTEQTGRMLLLMLKRAMDGLWTEKGFEISNAPWQQLLAEHKKFIR